MAVDLVGDLDALWPSQRDTSLPCVSPAAAVLAGTPGGRRG
jgi:hypothetical protein